MKSIATVVNDGLPPVVVRLPRARKIRHISENTTQYVATKITPFLSRCSAELSTRHDRYDRQRAYHRRDGEWYHDCEKLR